MPHISVHVHFVWATKNKVPFLHTPELRQAMWSHIREYARSKSIYVDFVGGYHDHCHCLVSMGPDQTMSSIMKLVKGESSFWMNKQCSGARFSWQTEYYAVSVSPRGVNFVREYIKNQEEHHRGKTFQQEYETVMKEFGFRKFD